MPVTDPRGTSVLQSIRPTLPFDDWRSAVVTAVEGQLEASLPEAIPPHERLASAMRYACLGGGKRVRPLIVFAVGEAFMADVNHCLVAAAAIEMVHVYSLVHDDLPCMDDDTLRRGRPTCHVAFDEATALLVGDALQTEAFRLLSSQSWPAATTLAMIKTLADAAGAKGMAGGQALDLAATGKTMSRSELATMHRLKTGALIRAAAELGALAGGVAPGSALLMGIGHIADKVGLLFQVIDDILDVSASSEILGKTAGKDIQQAKSTYVSLLGMSEAQTLAKELQSSIERSLNELLPTATRLRELCRFLAVRAY